MIRISRYDSSSAMSSRTAALPAPSAEARRGGGGASRAAVADDSFSISRALACADNPKRLRPAATPSLRRFRFDLGRIEPVCRKRHGGQPLVVGHLVALGKTE